MVLTPGKWDAVLVAEDKAFKFSTVEHVTTVHVHTLQYTAKLAYHVKRIQ
jgi:hypothetical protein